MNEKAKEILSSLSSQQLVILKEILKARLAGDSNKWCAAIVNASAEDNKAILALLRAIATEKVMGV